MQPSAFASSASDSAAPVRQPSARSFAAAAARAGATGISVDFTMPDLVDTLAAKALPLDPGLIEAGRRELDAKDAGGLKDVGGAAYLPLLYATGPFDEAVTKLAAHDIGRARRECLRRKA